jgi:hypothetical protein
MGTSTVSGPFRSQNGFQELVNGEWVPVGGGGGGGVSAITAGSGIAVDQSTGNVTVSNTGVTSLTTSSGLSTNTSATGAVSITNTGVTSLTTSSGLSTNTSATGAVSITNTGVTGITTNTGLSTNTSATGLVTITNTGVRSITTSSGLSANTNATGAVSVTNTGVTSAVAGTGISVSSGTGAVTIGNTGVTSVIAGSGISVSGATGAVTISASGGSQTVVIPRTSTNNTYYFDVPTQIGQTWNFALAYPNGTYGGLTTIAPNGFTSGASGYTFMGTMPRYDGVNSTFINAQMFGITNTSIYVMGSYFAQGTGLFTYVQIARVTYVGKSSASIGGIPANYDVYQIDGYQITG